MLHTIMSHTRDILLVDSEDIHADPLMRWLREAGYNPTRAATYEAASDLLTNHRYHLAIVDICLDKTDPDHNRDGLILLQDIAAHKPLAKAMTRFVLTHDPHRDDLKILYRLGIARFFIKDDEYKNELIAATADFFEDQTGINFDLEYDVNCDIQLHKIADSINWSQNTHYDLSQLEAEIYDLIGKLFYRAETIYFQQLTPGLTGAAILQIEPTMQRGVGTQFVMKIGPRRKIEIEATNFEEHVQFYMQSGRSTQMQTAYAHHLGAICYTFAQNHKGSLAELDAAYKSESAENIIQCLENLFDLCSKAWYQGRELIPGRQYVPDEYYVAFDLDEDPAKLARRIQGVLPEFDPHSATFTLENSSVELTNPIAWLNANQRACTMRMYRSITHGDLTGRNVMVASDFQCWLIDFYRTEPAHIMRDFVILETDIKYRLMPEPTLADFLLLEDRLYDQGDLLLQYTTPFPDEDLSPAEQKALDVLLAIRRKAYQVAWQDVANNPQREGHKVRKEYLIALLMATLNVVRLRHITEPRKILAMVSAATICDCLNELNQVQLITSRPFGDQTYTPAIPSYRAELDDIRLNYNDQTTAQERYLLRQLRQRNVMLLVGSAESPGGEWPTLAALAQELARDLPDAADLIADASPTDIFSRYADHFGQQQLIERQHAVYARTPLPEFFKSLALRQVSALPDPLCWQAIYTTNRHTYLETALAEAGIAYTRPDAPPDHASLPIYHITDSLDASSEPIIPPGIEHTLDQLNEGALMVMVNLSPPELDWAYRYREHIARDGALWLVRGQISEHTQDQHRRQGLRLINEDPTALFRTLELLDVEQTTEPSYVITHTGKAPPRLTEDMLIPQQDNYPRLSPHDSPIQQPTPQAGVMSGARYPRTNPRPANLWIHQTLTDPMLDRIVRIIPSQPVKIGRGSKVTVNLDGDPAVSRSHLELRYSRHTQTYEAEVLTEHPGFTEIDGQLVNRGEVIPLPDNRPVIIKVGNLRYDTRTVVLEFMVELPEY